MGSPVSPIIANLYMEEFENHALRWFTGIKPSVWLRYVDDTFVIIKTSEQDSFFKFINETSTYIKFTQECMTDNCLPFLDCLVSLDPTGSLHCSVYRKKTHTDQYLLFDSHHPLIHKYGVVRTLHHRADTIITDRTDQISEREHVNGSLSVCGYPRWAINTALRRKTHPRETPWKPRATISFPYVQGVSEHLQRICREFDIKVAHKPFNTLREQLVHPKDKPSKDQASGVVYGIHCEGEGCGEFYIGETEQPLKKRMYQHKKVAGEGTSSAVYNHLHSQNHGFENDNVEILGREKNWFERGVKEAIFVKALNPSLNKHGGVRFKISSAWDRNIRQVAHNANARTRMQMPSALEKET